MKLQNPALSHISKLKVSLGVKIYIRKRIVLSLHNSLKTIPSLQKANYTVFYAKTQSSLQYI